MCMIKSFHARKPRGCCQWTGTVCGYLPCLIAIGLVAANILPFHLCLLPLVKQACVKGTASWVYYYYALGMMIFAELMVYGNFVMAVATCPGFVPSEPWSRPPVYNGHAYSDNPFEVRTYDREGRLRYCSKCEQYKPDHAHHCHICGKCVYRMDHHCPWINNCVGRENSKFFLLFVGYIPLGAFHIVVCTAYSAYFQLASMDLFSIDGDNLVTSLIVLISLVLSTAMGIAFAAFGVHFLCMACRGETSVSKMIAERSANQTAKALAPDFDERDAHLYDIFGSDRRWWVVMLPFKPVRDARGLPGLTMTTLAELSKVV